MPDNLAAKDPDAIKRYGVDWSPYLSSIDSDAIATSTWFVVGDGADLTIDSDDHDETSTVVWLSGGALGRTGQLTNRITTTAGEQADKTLTIRIRSQ